MVYLFPKFHETFTQINRKNSDENSTPPKLAEVKILVLDSGLYTECETLASFGFEAVIHLRNVHVL